MKKLLQLSFVALVAFILALAVNVESVKASSDEAVNGFIKLSSGRSLYTIYTPPTEVGKPTVVLLHGLTYSTWQWNKFSEYLREQGYGVVQYDMYGMGHSLSIVGLVTRVIPYYEQVEDLAELLQVLEVEGPYNLAGLSYGGGIATAFAEAHSSSVANLFLMAPYTEPVAEQDKWIRDQITLTRQFNPFNPFSDDQLYDYFLKQIVYSTYPVAEPIVLSQPFMLESVFRMVQGIRKYSSSDSIRFFPADSVHLMVATKDQYITRDVMDAFWAEIPEATQGSYLYIHGAEHKIPQSTPEFAAGWIVKVLEGAVEPRAIYQGHPLRGVAISGEKEISLPRGINHVAF